MRTLTSSAATRRPASADFSGMQSVFTGIPAFEYHWPMDRLTSERRSWLMGRIRSKNTGPELAVRRLVYGMGYRYRLHEKRLPGTPDLVFWRHRKAIFVHGCFWHGHARCRYGRLPKSRVDYWKEKLVGNKKRDLAARRKLSRLGWHTLVVWQCELKRPEYLAEKLREFLEAP